MHETGDLEDSCDPNRQQVGDTERDLRVVPRVAGVRTSGTLGRYSLAIRAACAKQRSCGTAQGAISDGRPYRDLKMPTQEVLSARVFS